MQSVDISALKEWAQTDRDFLLIDVREVFEHEARNLGGLNIPLSDLAQACSRLPKDKDIVIYCAKGIRSVIAIQKMEQKGFTKLFNLAGGIEVIPISETLTQR